MSTFSFWDRQSKGCTLKDVNARSLTRDVGWSIDICTARIYGFRLIVTRTSFALASPMAILSYIRSSILDSVRWNVFIRRKFLRLGSLP